MTAYSHPLFDSAKPQTNKPMNEAKLHSKKQLEDVWKLRQLSGREYGENGDTYNFMCMV
jgi:hypothetical protein